MEYLLSSRKNGLPQCTSALLPERLINTPARSFSYFLLLDLALYKSFTQGGQTVYYLLLSAKIKVRKKEKKLLNHYGPFMDVLLTFISYLSERTGALTFYN